MIDAANNQNLFCLLNWLYYTITYIRETRSFFENQKSPIVGLFL